MCQALWRPNARIDGLSLIGASNAPGVLVNGYAHYLEVSNNKIYTNSGTYAGGIQLGHPGAAAPFNDEDAHNDHVAIHNNMVTQNAANETGGGGGIVLGTGSTNYTVRGNFVAANLTAGNGGGIAHIGRSEVGVIDGNTVIFNESFVQQTGTNGGGIFIGGTPGTAGSGEVDVTNNLIQGNAASGGDGGGIALQGFTNSDRVHLYNNMIANNVAGLAGGGVSIAGVPGGGNPNNPIVDITHNTIVNNDSTGTAGGAFASPLTSTPQPAGIAGRDSVARVRIANSIVWHNRTFYFGRCTPPPGGRCGILPVGASDPTQYAEIQLTNRPYWDLANLSGSQFAPISSVLSSLSGPSSSANYLAGTNNVSYASNNNSAAAPLLVTQYFNADRRYAYQVGETTGEATLISVPAALDEGGNFIRPQFGPLSLENPLRTPPNQRFGDYHVTGGLAGAALCGNSGIFNGSCPNAVPAALQRDFDGDSRPTGAPPPPPHRGADQASQTVMPPPPPTLSSITPQQRSTGQLRSRCLARGHQLGGGDAGDRVRRGRQLQHQQLDRQQRVGDVQHRDRRWAGNAQRERRGARRNQQQQRDVHGRECATAHPLLDQSQQWASRCVQSGGDPDRCQSGWSDGSECLWQRRQLHRQQLDRHVGGRDLQHHEQRDSQSTQRHGDDAQRHQPERSGDLHGRQ